MLDSFGLYLFQFRIKDKLREEAEQQQLEAERIKARQAQMEMFANMSHYEPFDELQNTSDSFNTSDSDQGAYSTPPSSTPPTVSSLSSQTTTTGPRVTSVAPPKPSWANLVTGTPSDPFFQVPAYAPPSGAGSSTTSSRPSFADALKNKGESNNNSSTGNNNNNHPPTGQHNSSSRKKKQVVLLSNAGSRNEPKK